MNKTLTWGILGTGEIANVFAKSLAFSRTGTLLAVGSRTQTSAVAFGDTWNVPHRYGSYDLLLKDSEVQAVYIATPNSMHAEWTIKADSLKFEAGPSQDVVLEWATYYDAADQAGISRLYGGIHIAADDFTGRRVGSDCGKAAWVLAQRYFRGIQ